MTALSLVQLSSIIEGDLSKVESARLCNRGLETIENLSCLRSLKRIELDDNRLSDLEFLNLNIELCWIAAQRNAFTGPLGSSAFRNLSNLTVLNLSNNQITSINDALDALPNIKTLILSGNCLKSIRGLGKLQKLETLVLSNNQLDSFSMPQKPLPNLKKLSLASNRIKELVMNEHLFNVRELRLNNNKLIKIPENLFYCGQLFILDIGKNCLTQSVDDCCNCLRRSKHLRSLNLAGNTKLAETPDDWENLRAQLQALIPSLTIFNSKNFSPSVKRRKRDREERSLERHSNRKPRTSATCSATCSEPDQNDSHEESAQKRPRKSGSKRQECEENYRAPVQAVPAVTTNASQDQPNSLFPPKSCNSDTPKTSLSECAVATLGKQKSIDTQLKRRSVVPTTWDE